MFCNKARLECHDKCSHAGRHKEHDGCSLHYCCFKKVTTSCIESTLSNEYANPFSTKAKELEFHNACDELDRLEDEAERAADAIIDAFDEDEDEDDGPAIMYFDDLIG